MNTQLIVLVGGSSSERRAYTQKHLSWVAVSRDALLDALFPGGVVDEQGWAFVEQMSAVIAVELLESQHEQLCIDAPNLTREEREAWVGLARSAGRKPVAHVMPGMRSDGPRDPGGDELSAEIYEPPSADEGFTEVLYVTEDERPAAPVRKAKKRTAAPPAMPLFSRMDG
jgi:hypothetical protein